MTLTLSSADLLQLDTTVRTLLAPLAYESVHGWRTEVSKCVRTLLQADKAGCFLAMEGEEYLVGEAIDAEGFQAYADYYWKLDVGYQVQRKTLGLEVISMSMVYDMAALPLTEVYNDFSRHYGFLDALTASTDLDPSCPPGAIVVYHDSESKASFGERGVMLMQLLLPALKAGITESVRFRQRRNGLTQFLDSLSDGCRVMDAAGSTVHQTRALDTLLLGDPERGRIQSEMHQLTATLLAMIARRERRRIETTGRGGRRTVQTAHATYQIDGSFLGDPSDPAVLVLLSVRCVLPQPLSDADVSATFRLTPRELQVARLIEAGRSTIEIADELAVTRHTVLRHTEHILSKLGVHSRAALGARLRHAKGPVPSRL